jgi:hypothetical protein
MTYMSSMSLSCPSSPSLRQVDLPTILYALNDFFSVYPRKDKGSEVQYDAAVGLLKRLVLHIGSDRIVGIISETLPGATGRPLLATLQKEMSSTSDGRRGMGAGGGGSQFDLSGSSGDLSPELAELISRMQSSMASSPDEAVEVLYAFKQKHPSVDVAAHLGGVSGVYKGFILSQVWGDVLCGA